MADRFAMAFAEACWKLADGFDWVADALGAASEYVNEVGYTVIDRTAEYWENR